MRKLLASERAAELSLLAITAVWGLTFVTVQDAISAMPASTFLAWRFLIAAAALACVMRSSVRALSAESIRTGLWMGVFLTAGYLFQTYGLAHTSASNAGFITGMFVVITPLLAWVVNRKPIGRLPWIAAFVSAFGLYLLSGSVGGFTLMGDGFELLCAIAFSIHIIVTDRAIEGRDDIAGLVIVQLAMVGFVSLGMALAAGEMEVPSGGGIWGAILLCALAASALAFMVQTWAQRVAPPARTALILAGEPAFAGFFGWWLAGDRLSPISWVGAALILASIVAVDAVPRLRPQRGVPEG